MRVVIRADASVWIGSGHIMRCLVLADALKQRGDDVLFACTPQAGDLIDFIISKGHQIVCLKKPAIPLIPSCNSDYAAWLQKGTLEDSEEFLSEIEVADWVVVDHYGINKEWENTVRTALSCRILAIDDLNRNHHCDLILDQNLWEDQKARYSFCDARKLLGPKFALLRPSFSELKQNPLNKLEQVLVFFGGTDSTGECLKLLKAVSKSSELPFVVKVITGRSNVNFEQLKQFEVISNVEVKRYLDDFDHELASSKYAIGASGVSNWERFCLQIPSSIVSVAENQMELSAFLAKKNYVHLIGNGSQTTEDHYQLELARLTRIWSTIRPYNAIDVDGFGAQRVVFEMENYDV